MAGIVLGVLLSGAVLGNLAPDLYERLFLGGGEAADQLAALLREQQQTMAALTATGVTEVALQEQAAAHEREALPLRAALHQARTAHARWLAARLAALILAVAVVMVLEALVSPQPGPDGRAVVPRALGRLITVRYALVAVWLALVIAQPMVLAQLPWLFVALVIVVCLAAAFVPLGPKRRAS